MTIRKPWQYVLFAIGLAIFSYLTYRGLLHMGDAL
jgi:hypothetical protein